MRHNGGGDATTYGPLLNVLGSSAVNRPGRFFTMIGRRTFSAGGNFVTELEQTTDTLFVGEPTGGSPVGFGEVRSFRLPGSGHAVYYSTSGSPANGRLQTTIPDVTITPTIDDWIRGDDPVLARALGH